ncbi:MAG: tetratricopeptide repeat protein [Zoogloeaceae bacterium]|nr:tetratricopeptide repeat protein [Rhodocyclaceae bacterium]MCP5237082.1 tetratricopeptide repeat protein [Zoogloeaceae bacterium]
MRITRLAIGWALAVFVATAATADGGGASAARNVPRGSDLARAIAAIEGSAYQRAIGLLETHTRRNPTDADGWNWLGFARRKAGALDAAFIAYRRALQLDPKHRGAHEYLGEAYLQAGDLASAEKHLAILDQLCWLPCEQYSDLKAAIASYRASPH